MDWKFYFLDWLLHDNNPIYVYVYVYMSNFKYENSTYRIYDLFIVFNNSFHIPHSILLLFIYKHLQFSRCSCVYDHSQYRVFIIEKYLWYFRYFFSIFILFIILLFTTIYFASISTYSVKSQGLLLKLFHIHISDIINNSCSHFYHRFNVTKFFRFYIPFSLDFSIHRNYTIIINTFVQLFPFFPFFCPCLFQCKQQQH